VSKLTSIVFALALVAGCRDKSRKQHGAGATQGSATSQGDPAWLDRLPVLASGEQPVRLQYAAGLVKLGADGTIHVATPAAESGSGSGSGSASASDPFAGGKQVQIAGLEDALGLVAIPPRAESPYGVIDSRETGSGSAAASGESSDAALAALGHPVAASGAPRPPTRVTTAFATRHPHEVSGGVVVFADAKAPAGALVDVLAHTGGFLAVHHGTQLAALPLALDRHAPALVAADRTWVEIRLDGAIEVEQVPSKSVPAASIDQLIPALAPYSPTAVDILVGPNARVQDVVDVLQALQGSKVAAFGFGRLPQNSDELAARGDHGPRVVAWNFFSPTIDAAALPKVREAFDKALEPMRGCYRDALAKTPDLDGVANVDFTIASNTKLAGATAKGAPPALATCVTTALEAAAFPQPKGNEGARVLATIAFLPR
jgi:hypothetical protein